MRTNVLDYVKEKQFSELCINIFVLTCYNIQLKTTEVVNPLLRHSLLVVQPSSAALVINLSHKNN